MGPVMERSSGSRMFPAPQMGLGGRNGQILGDKTDVRVNGRFGAPESLATRLKGAGNTAWGNAPGKDTAERVEPCKGEVMEVQSDGYGAPSGLDRFRTIFSRGVAPGSITSAFQAGGVHHSGRGGTIHAVAGAPCGLRLSGGSLWAFRRGNSARNVAST